MEGQEPNGAQTLDEAVTLSVLSHHKSGDFTVRVPGEWTGVAGKVACVTKPVDSASLLVLGEWLPSDPSAGEPPAGGG
jgi:hypothetical protein